MHLYCLPDEVMDCWCLQGEGKKVEKVHKEKNARKRKADAENEAVIDSNTEKKKMRNEKKEEKGKKKKVSSEEAPAPVIKKKSLKDKVEKKSKNNKEKKEKKKEESLSKSKKKEETLSKSKKKKGENGKSEKKKKKKVEKKKRYNDDGEEGVPENESLGKDQPDSDNPGNTDVQNDDDIDEYNEENAGNTPGSASKAFQRVKAEEWLGKKGSWDNSYEGTFGQAGWGFKAQQALGKVRGKDFRHEKTKKKRGSYRGGAIDPHAVCSYKFDSDDD